MKKFKELREHSLEEKLKASDPAGTYVSDFVHSDNPKFEGKSKAKRIQMALAASYAAKGKSKNEEVEQQDEAMSHQAATTMKHIPNPSPALKKAAKDIKPGIAGYRDRIDMLKAGGVKEEPEQVEEAANAAQQAAIAINMKKQGKKPKHMGEDVEQIDELSKSTLGSYVKKATSDAVVSRKIGTDFEHRASRAKSSSMKGASTRLSDRFNNMSKKRQSGVGKAVERLTKEDFESVEEGIMNAVKNLAAKAGKALTGGSDEDQRKDLQRKMGVPQTGKKPMKEGTVSEKFYDEEGEMVSAQLRSIVAKANAMLAKLSDDTELEAWVQAKVTTAEDSITCVHDHLMYGKDTTE